MVYTPVCAYYVTETPKAVYVLRVYVDDRKHLRFSLGALNTAEEREIYLCSYFEPMLRNVSHEDFFARMNKFGKITPNGNFILKNTSDEPVYLAIRCAYEGDLTDRYQTTAKNDFLRNKGGNLTNAACLRSGHIDTVHEKTNTTDVSVACDMLRFTLPENGFVQISYEAALFTDEAEAIDFIDAVCDASEEEEALKKRRVSEQEEFENTGILFEDWHTDKIHPKVLNNFLECVKRQVSLCALGKNYAGEFLGIRDVFQQLELSLIWQKDLSRAQLVRVMNYILEDGRPPRQTTVTQGEGQLPKMDLRPFIDQGFWIISAFHTYLSYTDDLSILREDCGYYRVESTYGPLSLSAERDSVLEHLIRIMGFLTSNIDPDTGCVRALYGDWNDALDGLGGTTDPTKEFGNGVSVMATLQMYLSFSHMIEILEQTGGYEANVSEYRTLQNTVAEGFAKYALLTDEQGVTRIAHGWGEDRKYYVGSYCDYDKKGRISLTANAFFAISGIVERFPERKEDIVKNILSLDTRFGLLTFDTPFYPYAPEVGRISKITPGTYENSCTYVHAGTFGASALFLMGHSEDAWRVLEKAMVISHPHVTMSTFVMPNSYCIDGEFDFDGESMGDWYTGSGAVLMKNIIKYGFGIEPTLTDVKIFPSAHFPAASAKMKLCISGKSINIVYRNEGNRNRKILLNSEPCELISDSLKNTCGTSIPKSRLTDNMTVTVVD